MAAEPRERIANELGSGTGTMSFQPVAKMRLSNLYVSPTSFAAWRK